MPTTLVREVRSDRSAAHHTLSQQDAAVTCISEILFIDPAVSDIDVYPAGVRPGGEAIVPDAGAAVMARTCPQLFGPSTTTSRIEP